MRGHQGLVADVRGEYLDISVIPSKAQGPFWKRWRMGRMEELEEGVDYRTGLS